MNYSLLLTVVCICLCMCVCTCNIRSICMMDGGTLARGRDKASSSFRLRVMMLRKWSRASWRTEGSFPWGHTQTHTHTHKYQYYCAWRLDKSVGVCGRVHVCVCAPAQGRRWPAAWRGHCRRKSPTCQPASPAASDLVHVTRERSNSGVNCRQQ